MMTVPRPLHHFLVSGITQSVLVVAAVLVLLPTGLLFQLPLGTLGAIFLYNVLIATLVAIMLTNHSLENTRAVVKGAGLVIGHLVGLVLGAFIGAKYGGTLWAILGGGALYFFVGWVGTRISMAADRELEKLGAPRKQSAAEKLVQSSQRRGRPVWRVYGAAVPGLLLVAALFMKISHLPVGIYASDLPIARAAIAALSLISIAVPWLRRQRASSHRSMLALAGLALSLAPAIYGFVLFIGFGLSITELIIFAATASFATATWSVRAAR